MDIKNKLEIALQCPHFGQEAEQLLGEITELSLTFDEYVDLGELFMDLMKFSEAIKCYKNALKHKPDAVQVHIRLGDALRAIGDPKLGSLSIVCYQQALSLDPHNARIYDKMGLALSDLGEQQEAISCFRKALKIKPELLRARFNLCMCQIPILYEWPEDILRSRRRYRQELKHLCQIIRVEDAAQVEEAVKAICSLQSCFLAYQNQNDVALQRLSGALTCRILAARYPQWAQAPPLPPHRPGEPLRVGMVSGFFYRHSNWKMPIKGWVENLSRERFQLCGYYTGTIRDKETEQARRTFSRFVEGVYAPEKLAQIIYDDRLHILIYPETRMDPLTMKLAALRLAPIQCISWGHPVTSGMRTMDYFLSSQLMEPPGAERHYSEQLVRLPNLSICYAPLEIRELPVARCDFGLRAESILFFCAQSLFKYLPQYDGVFARIAREADNCQFAFIQGKSVHLNNQFRNRLLKAFAREGLRGEDHVVLLPHLDPERYHAMNRLADIFLDSIGWSGCNSTMEAIACDLPIVTMPGKFMRGRHSLAILNMMGVEETIAANVEEYISLAVKLALDVPRRQEVAAKIAANKHKIYGDLSCIAGLEEFLETAVRSFQGRGGT
jgi:protein O-GlcNAc transferase